MVIKILIVSTLLYCSSVTLALEEDCFSLQPYFAYSSVLTGTSRSCPQLCEALQCTMYLTSATGHECLLSKFPLLSVQRMEIPFCGSPIKMWIDSIQIFPGYTFHRSEFPSDSGSLREYANLGEFSDASNQRIVDESSSPGRSNKTYVLGQKGYFRYPTDHITEDFTMFGNLVSFWLVEHEGFNQQLKREGHFDVELVQMKRRYQFNRTHYLHARDKGGAPVILPLNSTPKISQPGWHHLAFTCELATKTLLLYIDGHQYANEPCEKSLELETLKFAEGAFHFIDWSYESRGKEDLIIRLARNSVP